MLTTFIHLLQWFRVIGYSEDEIAETTVTIEFPTTYARNRAYSRLLDDAGCPPSGKHPVTLDGGYLVRVCGINVRLAAKREGFV